MEQSTGKTQTGRPSLVVVTGRPGAGKTSLVHALARAIRCPAICRDEIREGLINTVGRAVELPADANLIVYNAFFDTVSLLLSRNISVVAEAAFQHKNWAEKLEVMSEVADVRIIVCTIDPKLALARRLERCISDAEREQFHPDPLIHAAREGRDVTSESYEAPCLDEPTLIVDTSAGYQPTFETIVSFARNGFIRFSQHLQCEAVSFQLVRSGHF